MQTPFDEFVARLERADQKGWDDKIAQVEEIYRHYGMNEDSGDLYECFVALPRDAQEEVIDALMPVLEPGYPGFAEELYLSSLPYKGKSMRYPYQAGIVDFYEALKEEGIDVGF